MNSWRDSWTDEHDYDTNMKFFLNISTLILKKILEKNISEIYVWLKSIQYPTIA